jgi:hypothetical protein
MLVADPQLLLSEAKLHRRPGWDNRLGNEQRLASLSPRTPEALPVFSFIPTRQCRIVYWTEKGMRYGTIITTTQAMSQHLYLLKLHTAICRLSSLEAMLQNHLRPRIDLCKP